MKRLRVGLASVSLAAMCLVSGAAWADVPPAPPPDEGCGCRTSSQETGLAGLSLLVMGAGGLLLRRSPRGNNSAE